MMTTVLHSLRACSICAKETGFYQQLAFYKAPRVHPVLRKRVEEHQRMRIRINNAVANINRNVERKAFAKLGTMSGIDPGQLFLSEKNVLDEIEAEERWWPSLKEMEEKIAKKNGEKRLKREERQRKIDENMAKMPQWIEKYKQQLEGKHDPKPKKKATDAATKIPSISFLMKPSHPQLIRYIDAPKDVGGIEIVRSKVSFSKKKKKT